MQNLTAKKLHNHKEKLIYLCFYNFIDPCPVIGSSLKRRSYFCNYCITCHKLFLAFRTTNHRKNSNNFPHRNCLLPKGLMIFASSPHPHYQSGKNKKQVSRILRFVKPIYNLCRTRKTKNLHKTVSNRLGFEIN